MDMYFQWLVIIVFAVVLVLFRYPFFRKVFGLDPQKTIPTPIIVWDSPETSKGKKKKLKISKKQDSGTSSKVKVKRRKKKKKKKPDTADSMQSANVTTSTEQSEPEALLLEKIETNLVDKIESCGMSSVTSSSRLSAEISEAASVTSTNTDSILSNVCDKNHKNRKVEEVKGKKKKRKRKKKKGANGSSASPSVTNGENVTQASISDDYVLVSNDLKPTEQVEDGWATVGKGGKAKVKNNHVTCFSVEESITFTTHDQNDVPPELQLTEEETYGHRGISEEKRSADTDAINTNERKKQKKIRKNQGTEGSISESLDGYSIEELQSKLMSYSSSDDLNAIPATISPKKTSKNRVRDERQPVFPLSSFDNIVVNYKPKRKRHKLYWAEIAEAFKATDYSVQSASSDYSACFLHALFKKQLNFQEIRYHMSRALLKLEENPLFYVTYRWSEERIQNLILQLRDWVHKSSSYPLNLPSEIWSPEPLVRAIASVTSDIILIDAALQKLDNSLSCDDEVICELYDSYGGISQLTDKNLSSIAGKPLKFIYFPHTKLKHWFYVQFYRGDTLL